MQSAAKHLSSKINHRLHYSSFASETFAVRNGCCTNLLLPEGVTRLALQVKVVGPVRSF